MRNEAYLDNGYKPYLLLLRNHFQANDDWGLKPSKIMSGSLYLVDRAKVSWFMCHTLEPPWKNNERNISCIPQGEYPIVRRKIGRYYEAYKKRWNHNYSMQIADVPDRSTILIHTGNTLEDTRGCVIVGTGGKGNMLYKSWEAYTKLYNSTSLDIRQPKLIKIMNFGTYDEVIRNGEAAPVLQGSEREEKPGQEL